jgi:hypothetical protein
VSASHTHYTYVTIYTPLLSQPSLDVLDPVFT